MAGEMVQRWGFNPFTIFDTKGGIWLDKKREWLAKGIQSELGRPDAKSYDHSWAERKGRAVPQGDGVSVFDPFLCEVIYRYYCPAGGKVLDPFAGGSVRGVVAGCLGLQYTGIELNAEQISANNAQVQDICPDASVEYRHGDCWTMLHKARGLIKDMDLVFTCPPYGNLERYSDDPDDLSTREYPDFLTLYRDILRGAFSALKPDRFFAIVVGDFRDMKTGNLHGLPADTVRLARDVGFRLWNDAILATPIGTLPVRAGKPFSVSRKLGRAHQYVCIFVKGSGEAAARACGAERIGVQKPFVRRLKYAPKPRRRSVRDANNEG